MAKCKHQIWNTNICSYLSEECRFTKIYLENLSDQEADDNCPYFANFKLKEETNE